MTKKLTAAPPKFLDLVTRHLKRLGDEGAALARYVETGDDADALLRLGHVKEAGTTLALFGVQDHNRWKQTQATVQERDALFRAGKHAPAESWQRFGEVLEAAGRATQRKLAPPADWPAWLAALVGELLITTAQVGRASSTWPADKLEEVFVAAGLAGDHVVRFLLDKADYEVLIKGSGYWYGNKIPEVIDEWPAFLARHEPAVRQLLPRLAAADCAEAFRLLNEVKYDFAPVTDLVAELGTSPSKTVREAALPVLLKHAAAAEPHVEKRLAGGDAGTRNEAAALLWRLACDKAADRLRKHAEGESAERVKQTIQKLLAAPAESSAKEVRFDLPPVTIELGQVPLPEAAKARVRTFFQKAHDQAMKQFEQELARWNGPDRPQYMSKPQKPEPLAESRLDELFEFVEGKRKTTGKRDDYQRPFTWNTTVVDDSFAPPGVHLIHVVRLCYALNRFDTAHNDQLWWRDTSDLEAYRGRCPEPFGLRELDAAVATLPDGKPGLVAYSYLANNTRWGGNFADWEPAAVWPAFVEKLDLLRDTLTGAAKSGQYDYGLPDRRRNAFRVLAMFPQLPPGFMTLLWDLALGESKTDRPLAQDALRTVPDKAAKVIVALGDGRQGVRAAAAEWLGIIGDPTAVEPLKAAFRAEKQEAVKGVMMTALERLGADVTEFLDRQALTKEAAAGLAKKRPAGMEWVPLDRLPAVRWEDTGKPVDPEVVRWWVVQAVQQKSPVAGPLLRRYLMMCKPADTAGLAKVLLAAWIGHDTRLPSADEAADRAKADAARQWKQWGSSQYFKEEFKTEKGLYDSLFKKYSNELAGSAIGEKGLLAVVSAAGDADCVRMCEQYIRKWFGQRLAQCKALVEMLAWVQHPTALQVLLALAGRFRTKAVRELAGEHVKAIAEREGWTIDELADRTLPDAGFAKPEGGGGAALVLDYGPRQFTVTLDDDLEPVIRADGGKAVKSLPVPGKADDPEKAKEAKKAFADAKKQVKDLVRRQTERLYEALCTQRSWRFADWKEYLADHPIVGRLCVRIAWVVHEPGDGGRFLGCFRPLEDGSLTNEKDEAVTFPADAVVRLAHTANTPADVAAAWRQHFTDYDVEPVFDQFGREAYALPEAKKKETAVTDFQGYGLTTFQMRGKATKLGYVRGEAEDGGWFYVYRKPFPSLALQVEIEFTGSYLPEQEMPAALKSLSFTRIKTGGDAGGSWSRTAVELAKVPPVLLSECYNDLKQLAAEGTGFDPEWEKKNYF